MSNSPISDFRQFESKQTVYYSLDSAHASELAKSFAQAFPDYAASPWAEDLGGPSRLVTAHHSQLGLVAMLIDGGINQSNSVIGITFEREATPPDLACKTWLPLEVSDPNYVNPWGIAREDLIKVPRFTPSVEKEEPKKKSLLKRVFGFGMEP